MIGRKFVIDRENKNEYPKVIDKKTDSSENGYIEFLLEDEEGQLYNAIVETVSSKGRYVVRVTSKA